MHREGFGNELPQPLTPESEPLPSAERLLNHAKELVTRINDPGLKFSSMLEVAEGERALGREMSETLKELDVLSHNYRLSLETFLRKVNQFHRSAPHIYGKIVLEDERFRDLPLHHRRILALSGGRDRDYVQFVQGLSPDNLLHLVDRYILIDDTGADIKRERVHSRLGLILKTLHEIGEGAMADKILLDLRRLLPRSCQQDQRYIEQALALAFLAAALGRTQHSNAFLLQTEIYINQILTQQRRFDLPLRYQCLLWRTKSRLGEHSVNLNKIPAEIKHSYRADPFIAFLNAAAYQGDNIQPYLGKARSMISRERRGSIDEERLTRRLIENELRVGLTHDAYLDALGLEFSSSKAVALAQVVCGYQWSSTYALPLPAVPAPQALSSPSSAPIPASEPNPSSEHTKGLPPLSHYTPEEIAEAEADWQKLLDEPPSQ